ncbi:hypothetical protein BDV18DRAFT_159689 [Aspergillus unguis]
MSTWTHLVRFVAVEDNQIHLGQLTDPSRDVGIDSIGGVDITVYLIKGTLFASTVTDTILHVKHLLSPISKEECTYIRCLGLNYLEHANEASLPLPKSPILFTKPRTALADPYPAPLQIPKCAQDGTSDYEAELCVVIGKTGRDIPEDKALEYVLGYTASNDVSCRFLQRATPQWSFSKGLDGSCPVGPVLVSPTVSNPQTLGLKAIYNGQVVQDGNTADMIFSIKQQIAYLSQGTTLEAGTLILTGTPAGIGATRQPKIVLGDGDRIDVWVEGVGTLINRVKYE